METQDETVAKIDAGGDAWDEDDEIIDLVVKQPLKVVVPVRLAAEQWEALRVEARNVGVGPSTLARMWLLEMLRQKQASASK